MSGIRAARRIVQAAQQVLRLAAQVVKHLVKQSVEHPVKHLVEVAVVPMPPADPHIAAACSAQAEHTVASVASASVTCLLYTSPSPRDCGAGRGGNGCADSDCAGAVSESFDGFMPFMVMMLNLTVITG